MKNFLRRSISTSVVLGLLLFSSITAYAADKTVEVNGSPWDATADSFEGDLTSQLSVSNVVETFDDSELGKDFDACFVVESPSIVTILTENGASFDVFKLTRTATEFSYDEENPLPVSGYYDNGEAISGLTPFEYDNPPLYMPGCSVTLTEPGDYFVYFQRDVEYADTEVFITVKGANDGAAVKPNPTKSETPDAPAPKAEPKPDVVTATPTSSKVMVDGKEIAFEAYGIGGNNYFKLRDLSMAINGSAKQFQVAWDGANNAINLTTNTAYTPVGKELTISESPTAKEARLTISKIYLNGEEVQLTAYNIGGSNYFKLRDIARIIDFAVIWDGDLNKINIDTSNSYVEEIK